MINQETDSLNHSVVLEPNQQQVSAERLSPSTHISSFSHFLTHNALHLLPFASHNIPDLQSESMMSQRVLFLTQIEGSLGCPGSKARIIHKESDLITAFAINKVSCSSSVGFLWLS